jgi:mRNA-degrading endonuclease RelE of RelBE toxin-antitoxin system
MQVTQSPKFQKKYKKLHSNQLSAINPAIKTVIDNPEIGQRKAGDLNGVYVYKFKMVNQSTLIAYEITDAGDIVLEFLDFGPHENFYRDLKKY